jgi:hypothetical protein
MALLTVSAAAQAQTPGYRHSVGLGFERVGLDAPDATGNRYLMRYARHFRNDRLVLIGTLGYVNAPNRRYLPLTNNVYVTGKRRERLTADATFAFDFLSHSRQALRLGAGPSLWYRQDELMGPSRYTVLADGSVANAQINWFSEKEVNYGFNVLVEYEYALTEKVAVAANVKFVDLSQAGQSTIYGSSVSYRLP